MTSRPTRGRAWLPQLAPATGASGVATRTHVPAPSSAGAPVWPAAYAAAARGSIA